MQKRDDSDLLQMLQDLIEDQLRRGEIPSPGALRWYAKRVSEMDPKLKN